MLALIVDDSPLNIKLLRAVIEAEAIEVISATDGMEALDLLGRYEVQLIISDILMPKMDGFQLCMEVRKHPLLRGIPFIHYTATYTLREDEALSWGVGANLFFRKPDQGRELLAAIRRIASVGTSWLQTPNERQTEIVVLKQYNEILVRKLEARNLDLAREITANRVANDELVVARRRADELGRFREMLCSYMSDEVRAPLERVMMLAKLLSEDSRNDQTRNYSENIQNGATRVMTMLTSVMSLARDQSEPNPMQLQTIDLVASMRSLIERYAKSYENLEHKVISRLPDTELTVRANHEFLGHVVDNLLKSATKYTLTGVIGVELKTLDIDEMRWAMISINDQGADLKKEFASYLFEKPANTPRGAEPAIDLDNTAGLTITRRLVELMNGRLTVEASIGEGSMYRLYLPAGSIATDQAIPTSNPWGNSGLGNNWLSHSPAIPLFSLVA